MASVSANFLCARTSVRVPPNQMMLSKSLRLATVGWGRTPGFPRLATSRFQITCAAKKETVDKVCEIVRKQLALPADKEITPQTTFTDLGADSLDTVTTPFSLFTHIYAPFSNKRLVLRGRAGNCKFMRELHSNRSHLTTCRCRFVLDLETNSNLLEQ
ncbi:acyl carrier protein 2, chloroplastic-like isoform X2 [Salvia miltiorrhiza]|uniref:acyl carrier protein 2, chloroplastic-like isoform X2 n=1 Tax=Salvia miltiorrhiza TaxID=226208 RepID=UPI0025AD3170|nr:acyl carrier protein 2, chloroplastic-like isoform X2 [Salvia miltiorrhiza]XP_057767667.1 acyl carrier protein 2, chloroplastic-like isoform X2 [Salvia miltiorrhiza]XP_057767668.1 acyl carrier protein 2, chloroplastic-like isoform X2 [Salvia miltiorrhiza]